MEKKYPPKQMKKIYKKKYMHNPNLKTIEGLR